MEDAAQRGINLGCTAERCCDRRRRTPAGGIVSRPSRLALPMRSLRLSDATPIRQSASDLEWAVVARSRVAVGVPGRLSEALRLAPWSVTAFVVFERMQHLRNPSAGSSANPACPLVAAVSLAIMRSVNWVTSCVADHTANPGVSGLCLTCPARRPVLLALEGIGKATAPCGAHNRAQSR